MAQMKMSGTSNRFMVFSQVQVRASIG